MSAKTTAAQFTALLSHARNAEEIALLLEGILTPQELDEVMVRWELLVRLIQGQTQREIAHDMGISLGTIARGSRLLKYDLPEFRELVERISHDIREFEQSEK
ncbi:MAG: trp operon repressor [Candidatus Pacebacteria bacterium]|nr:trp operon repressor [Candidatus Paceibacterota bacterium]